MTVSSRLLRGALLVSLLLGTLTAHAQPSSEQKEAARALMAEARELRDRGDLEGALSRFSSADSIMNVPTTGFEVATTQAQLGRLLAARESLRRVLSIVPAADDPEPFNEARSKARTLDQQLLARLGTLRFNVSGLAAGDELSVLVDGQAVPGAARQPLRVDPGHHVVVARAGGRELKREVDAAEARSVDVELAFTASAEPAAAAPVQLEDDPVASQPPEVAASPPPSKGLPMLAYVGGGVGVAGLLVGSITGISAISHKNAAKKGCVDGSCPPSTWDDLDSAHSLATGSTVAFVVGALGLGVGIGAILLGDDSPRPSERALLVSPDVGPQGARLTVAGRF